MNNLKTYASKRLLLRACKDNCLSSLHSYYQDNFYKYALKTSYSFDNQSGFCFKAYNRHSKELIGFIKGYSPSKKNFIWIQVIIIDKKFNNLGYGQELVEKTISIINSHKVIEEIFLCCYAKNTIGIRFWDKLSFIKIKEIIKDLGCENNKIYIYKRDLMKVV